MRNLIWIAGALLLAGCNSGGSSGSQNDVAATEPMTMETPVANMAAPEPDNAATPIVEPTPTPSPTPTEEATANPSFRCAAAAGEAERMVCNSAKLAKLDREVARAYAAARRAMQGDDRAALEEEHRAFLAERNACATEACIADAYRSHRENLPDMSPVAESASCESELGAAKAKALADQCRQVSPATRPPCNIANACSMIRGEINRGCDMLDEAERPAFCPKK